jgi:hypothetical protein
VVDAAGHSFKQHEIVEASYRVTLSTRQTYIKLVDGGWVFDIGVRGSYKDKPIMKCIATEVYVAEEEHEHEVMAAHGRLQLIPRPFKIGEEPVEISPDGLTAIYRDLTGDHLSIIRGSIRLAGVEHPTLPSRMWGENKLSWTSRWSRDGPRPNYYEVRVTCKGARQNITVGLAGFSDELPDVAPGMYRRTYGLCLRDWSMWADGERSFCGRDRESERLSFKLGLCDLPGGLFGDLGSLADVQPPSLTRMTTYDSDELSALEYRATHVRDLRDIRKLFEGRPLGDAELENSGENFVGATPSEAKGGQDQDQQDDESKTSAPKEVKVEADVWFEVEALTPTNADEKVSNKEGASLSAKGDEEQLPALGDTSGSHDLAVDDDGRATMASKAEGPGAEDKFMYSALEDGDVIGCGIDHLTRQVRMD